MALFFTLINFSRGVGRSLSYFAEILEGWGGGGHQFLTNMENPGRWGGGVLQGRVWIFSGNIHFLTLSRFYIPRLILPNDIF